MLDYEPISRCRDDLATFSVADMQISGEFNFVYCNERVAREKITCFSPARSYSSRHKHLTFIKTKTGQIYEIYRKICP